MNERIIKLYEQALEFAYENVSKEIWNTDNFHAIVAGKFAELIVKECVGIVAKRKDQAIDDSWNVDEAMSMAEMDLLEHFGVEE
tara:strand:- start:378 stop:629 length:252 start_codon:yes stop_codon:yes gene_type:complete